MAPQILKSLTILTALLASLSIAAPVKPGVQKRDVVWETVTDVVWTTIDITTTVYLDDASSPPPAPTTTSTPSSADGGQFFQQTAAAAATSSSSTTSIAAASPAAQAPSQNYAPPPAPSSAYVPPAAPTSAYVPPAAPATTEAAAAPAYTPPAPSSPAAPPTSAASSGGSSGGQCSSGSPCTGDITFYQAGLGACGETSDGSTQDLIALPWQFMGGQSNGNPYCGKTITITKGGKTATGKVVDKCMSCTGMSIDLSNHLFDQLAAESEGRVPNVSWYFS